MKKTYQFTYGSETIILETNYLAKQAHGSVLLTQGKTQVLVTVCSSYDLGENQNFFPLTVDYKEKFFSAGKLLGGFLKREGRPHDDEILLMRMIDRPLRPLFPEGYYYETVITAQVLSFEEGKDPEILAGLGSSLALLVSDIPVKEGVAFAKIGLKNQQYLFNSSESSEMDIILACTQKAILMVEGEASEISEEQLLESLDFAQEQMKDYFRLCEELSKEYSHERSWIPVHNNIALLNKEQEEELSKCLDIVGKIERSHAIATFTKKLAEEDSEEDKKNVVFQVEQSLSSLMRNQILKEKKRIAGRSLDQVRSITSEVGLLKRPHGSSLFTRGETQVLGAVTLGGKEGEQLLDRIVGMSYSRFYLHYSFMPFSVGEAKMYRGVGRREVGHGNLAQRSLKMMLPSFEDFPYTIRVACEVLESNGSSSMASVCAGSLALMDAGVPLRKPVAGVAMGLILENDQYEVLTDILGDEDHLGDMDFKVAGTQDGITGIQMDIKVMGISKTIMKEALNKAKKARLHILEEMSKTLSQARTQLKEGAPLIEVIQIQQDQIGLLIGPGGKNVKALQEKYQVSFDIEDTGVVRILGLNQDLIQKSIKDVHMLLDGPVVGEIYEATVASIKPYGAFVDIGSQISGLVHVSEIANKRVEKVEDYLKEGDIVKVKVLGKDDQGKLKLSIKATLS